MWEAILITGVYFVFYILFRERPEFPPSHAAETNDLNDNETSYKETLKQLVRNK